MPQTFSAGLQALLASGYWRWHPFIEITLSNGTTLYYSTVGVTVAGRTYVNKLLKMNGGKISATKSVDRLSLTIDGTVPGDASGIVLPYLQKARALVGSLYVDIRDSANNYRVELDDGVVSSISQDDRVGELLFISSTYQEPVHSGGLPILRTCAWKYKSAQCSYAGALPTCDLTFDGINGCLAHFPNSQATAYLRFGGHALFLDAASQEEQQGGGTTTAGGGGGGNGDPNIAEGLPERNYWSPYGY